MIKIDSAKALELLELAVAERGAEYVYPHPSCAYTWRDSPIDVAPKPACIVGVALHKAGVPIDVLEGLEGNVEEAAYELRRLNVADVDAGARDLWLLAQQLQDGGFRDRASWGDALDAAKAATL